MGYYVRFLPEKKNSPVWKVQYISRKQRDRKIISKANVASTAWDIEKDRWRPLGFHPSMTIEEARVRAKQLNAQLRLQRQEEHLQNIKERQIKFQLRNEATLPEEFVAEFEERFVRKRGFLTEQQFRTRNRCRYTVWRAAQRIIALIAIEPVNWFYHQDYFYDQFYQNKYSLGYTTSILAMINLWGLFITRKMGQPFIPIRRPTGYERQRLLEAYYQKTSKHRKASDSTNPDHLLKIRNNINLPNFHWLYISVWLGLRPQEIDQLHNNEMWKMEVLPTGRKVLWVFQTKIIALPIEDRWKPIPIIFDEQHFALKMIEDKNFKRPLTKTIRFHIGDNHDTYGGRKGFVDLMLSKGQSLENISIWMGHSTLNRTWRNYKNKRIYQAC